ncbi:aspartate/glutamate racemase family protein [Sporosalibacterium faouarense]|uniref:aspartate/glutamate racemase family protein n=1 Tax=Sporosalibacterium faouarense TaxID=516123 RepID=UPI00192AC510|nr:amino acid racemase [Sporosalibacterium faouarense]
MSKTLGIIGGMGPLATCNLFEKIIKLTEADCDQDHLNILIYNNATIPDRTEYILGVGENPNIHLIESAKKLENSGVDFLVMPCNTAHYFYNDIEKEINIPLLSMIEETAKYINNRYAIHKIGLLSTEGTIKSKIYDDAFSIYDIEVIKPTNEKQHIITKLIHDIKAGSIDVDINAFQTVLDELTNKGVEYFILGCTEISTAYSIHNFEGMFIDPLELIAVRAIKFANKKVNQNYLKTIEG